MYAESGHPCMRTLPLLIGAAVVLATVAGCIAPPAGPPAPADVLRSYVLAFNRGDIAAIEGLLVPAAHPARDPGLPGDEVARLVNESRVAEGVRIADYTILEEEVTGDEAFLLVQVTWRTGDGTATVRTHDLAFLRVDGEWKLVDLLLPSTPGGVR
jgi:hypothetical protein